MPNKRGTPKYQVIKEGIEQWISEGTLLPSMKLPVEAELAEQFGASRQTVRQAVGELVQEGVLERKQGSGTFYRGKRPLESASGDGANSHIVGVITTYMSDYIFPHIIRGIEDHLSLEGFSPLLFSTRNDVAIERKALKNLLNKAVDAVIVEPTKSAVTGVNADLYETLSARGIPVVMIHARYDEWSGPLIEVDDRMGAVLATQHLLEQGHTRLGAIMKIDDKQGARRFEGYLQAGASYHADLISFYTTESQHRVSQQYVERLLRLPRAEWPTGLCCYNDLIATDVIVKLRELGISVPGDISVVGFDDSQLATMGYPPLTTVEHPKHEMGVKAAETVIQLLRSGTSGFATDTADTYTFTPKLIVRESTRDLCLQVSAPS